MIALTVGIVGASLVSLACALDDATRNTSLLNILNLWQKFDVCKENPKALDGIPKFMNDLKDDENFGLIRFLYFVPSLRESILAYEPPSTGERGEINALALKRCFILMNKLRAKGIDNPQLELMQLIKESPSFTLSKLLDSLPQDLLFTFKLNPLFPEQVDPEDCSSRYPNTGKALF